MPRPVESSLAKTLQQLGLETTVREWLLQPGAKRDEVVKRLFVEHGVRTSRRSLTRWMEATSAPPPPLQALPSDAEQEAIRQVLAFGEMVRTNRTLELLDEVIAFERTILRGEVPLADGTCQPLLARADHTKLRLRAAEGLKASIELGRELVKTEGNDKPRDPLTAMGDAMRDRHSPHANTFLEREIRLIEGAKVDPAPPKSSEPGPGLPDDDTDDDTEDPEE
jgi:hypothetical protein